MVPYRIDVPDPPHDALDTLVALGAIDVESDGATLAALLPDAVSPEQVAEALGVEGLRVSTAVGRDDGSVWMLNLRPVRIRTLVIAPAGVPAAPGALRLVDAPAFGTGLHATTALCLEALEDVLETSLPPRMLDVGTGSGILALAALRRGVPSAVGLDLDRSALTAAAENARLNHLAGKLSLVRGGPDSVVGSWPLVVANIRAGELMEMADVLARRTASRGRLLLSGIPEAVAPDVERTYRRLGMTRVSAATRGGWAALGFHPSW